jgi:hypothetical protein
MEEELIEAQINILPGEQLANDVLPNFQSMYARRPFQPG